MEDLKVQLERTAEPWLDVNERHGEILLSVQYHGKNFFFLFEPDSQDLHLELTEENLPFCQLVYHRLLPRFQPPAPNASRHWIISPDGRRIHQYFPMPKTVRSCTIPSDEWRISSNGEFPNDLRYSYHVEWHAFTGNNDSSFPWDPFDSDPFIDIDAIDVCLHLPAMTFLGYPRFFPKLEEKNFLVFKPLTAREGFKTRETPPPFYQLSFPTSTDRRAPDPMCVERYAQSVVELEKEARKCLLCDHSQKLKDSLDNTVRELLEQDSVSHQKALTQLSHLWLASDLELLPDVHVSLLKKFCVTCDDHAMTLLARSRHSEAPIAPNRLRAHLLRQCLTN